MNYTIYNQPKDLFKIPGACIFEVADFHVTLYPHNKTVIIFPLHEKDRFKKEAPDFGFLHSIKSCLLDIKATLREIRKKKALSKPKESIPPTKLETWVGSQIIAKIQLPPKGWSTQVKGQTLRKAPLFKHPMQPFLIFEMDVKTYVTFARSLTQMIGKHREQLNDPP